MNRSYRIALVCGALPLVTGISIFLLWLLTRWQWLMIAGFITVIGGIALFLTGVVMLANYCWIAFRTPGLSKRRVWWLSAGSTVLLFSNFVAAGGIIRIVIGLETRYVVSVRNDSSQPLMNVMLTGGGCDIRFGTVPSGGFEVCSAWIPNEGKLEFRATGPSGEQTQILNRHAADEVPGNFVVTISASGKVSGVNENAD